MVLLAAEGLSNAEIGRRAGMTRQTVLAWRARYAAGGIAALADLPVSFAEVARIWRDWDLQPHRVETFKFSTDPQLEAKARDVVGSTSTRPPTRWWSASTRSRRSRRWTVAHRCCRCG